MQSRNVELGGQWRANYCCMGAPPEVWVDSTHAAIRRYDTSGSVTVVQLSSARSAQQSSTVQCSAVRAFNCSVEVGQTWAEWLPWRLP